MSEVLSALWEAKEVILLIVGVVGTTMSRFNVHDKRISSVEAKCQNTYDPFFDKMFEDAVNRVIAKN
jgi:hypothetical protein